MKTTSHMTGHEKMDESNIAILGARGMLGTDLTTLLKKNKLNFKAFDLPDCDITDPENIQNAVKGCSVIINCAAYTNVEKAEDEPDLTFKVNADAVKNIADAAKQNNAYLLHLSTDFVFDGQLDRPYRESDQPNPISVYGKSKLAGEQFLIETGCNCSIIRIQWTYGLAGNNFVNKLITTAKKQKNLSVVNDQIGSPTATTEVAKVIYSLITKKTKGLFHFANAGFVTRYDMAKFIFDKLGTDIELKSCSSSEFKTKAKRPLNSRFDCTKISKILNEPIESWQKLLENFLRKL